MQTTFILNHIKPIQLNDLNMISSLLNWQQNGLLLLTFKLTNFRYQPCPLLIECKVFFRQVTQLIKPVVNH